jgi:hypothetical protein
MAVAAAAAAAAAAPTATAIENDTEGFFSHGLLPPSEPITFSDPISNIVPIGYYEAGLSINDSWAAIFAGRIHKLLYSNRFTCNSLKSGWFSSSYYIKISKEGRTIYLYFYENVLFINTGDLEWINASVGDFRGLLLANQRVFTDAGLSFTVFPPSTKGGYRRKTRKTRKGQKNRSKKRTLRRRAPN